jgi:hypothetical protein
MHNNVETKILKASEETNFILSVSKVEHVQDVSETIENFHDESR